MLAQSAAAIEQRLERKADAIKSLKREDATHKLTKVLAKALKGSKNFAWQVIADKACGHVRTQREVRDMFEMIEQEKVVLEEEYGNALTLNEDLQVQYEEVQKIRCDDCQAAEEQLNMNLMSS